MRENKIFNRDGFNGVKCRSFLDKWSETRATEVDRWVEFKLQQ
jgi:hypothetical protein